MIVCSIIFGFLKMFLVCYLDLYFNLLVWVALVYNENAEMRREEAGHGSHLWKFISKCQIQRYYSLVALGLVKETNCHAETILGWTVEVGPYPSLVPTMKNLSSGLLLSVLVNQCYFLHDSLIIKTRWRRSYHSTVRNKKIRLKIILFLMVGLSSLQQIYLFCFMFKDKQTLLKIIRVLAKEENYPSPHLVLQALLSKFA